MILTLNQPAKAVPWQTLAGFRHFALDDGVIVRIEEK